MALQKVDYVNQVTVITAENMNDIQDAIIALETAPAQGLTEDVKQALLQLAQKVAYIDAGGQTYYDDLYNALYPPKTVVSITAVFEQGSTVIYDDTALNDLKQYLTVTAVYDDNTTAILPDASYTLSGTLEAGTSSVTVNYNGVVTSFDVVVTARPTLSSITAVYTQPGTVYDTDTLDSLKADLVVTAVYSDSSTQTVPAADYTLSGTLTAGTSTITVSYGGMTTTFTVVVTEYVVEIPTEGLLGYWDFRNLESIPTSPVAADQGTARIVRFNASASDQYGLTKSTSAWAFNFSGGTSYSNFPVPFTIAGLSHDPKYAMSVWGNNGLVTASNINRFVAQPYYKNSGGTTMNVQEAVPVKSGAAYTSLIITVDNDSVDYYVDGELVKTWNTADLEDFASWSYTTMTYGNTGNGTNVTALGMWNRKLSAAEVMDVQEVFLSLEVTE